MADDRNTERGQSRVPKPPTREGIEELSRAQRFITDEWTGDGGKPPEGEAGKSKDGRLGKGAGKDAPKDG